MFERSDGQGGWTERKKNDDEGLVWQEGGQHQLIEQRDKQAANSHVPTHTHAQSEFWVASHKQ